MDLSARSPLANSAGSAGGRGRVGSGEKLLGPFAGAGCYLSTNQGRGSGRWPIRPSMPGARP